MLNFIKNKLILNQQYIFIIVSDYRFVQDNNLIVSDIIKNFI